MRPKAGRDRSRPARSAGGKAVLNLKAFAVSGVVASLVTALAIAVINSIQLAPDEAKAYVQLYKNPQCACCDRNAMYLRRHGYSISTTSSHNLSLIRRQHGVPDTLAGCHTTFVYGYVVEGHVPVAVLDRLLTESPKVRGISLPGMPEGSPGMSGTKAAPLAIYEISDDPTKIYATE